MVFLDVGIITYRGHNLKVALCFLTWNEIEGCKYDIPHIDMKQFDQVYCVDGGSTDGTVEYLTSQGIKVYPQVKKGLNQACKEAVKHCKCDAVVFFHPKGTVSIDSLYRFRALFEKGYELIVASRMMKDSINEEDSKLLRPRKWFGIGLGLLSMLLFKKEGLTIWDSLHGFRGVTVRAFKKMKISNMSPSVDIEMVSRSYKLHIKRIEFPTKEIPRISGSTHFKALPTGIKLLRYLTWEIFRKN